MTDGQGKRFRLRPVGPFSLAQAARFWEGFTPAAYDAGDDRGLDLAFVPDGEERAVGVRLVAGGEEVIGTVVGEAPPDRVRDQVARILSLDVDGSRFPEVAERDDVVGWLQRRYPGLRPVLFASPFEAACWAIIGQRIAIVAAAKIKARLAAEMGETVRIGERSLAAFPSPSALARLDAFPGLPDVKVARLRAAAEAARDGVLDAASLRSLPTEEALERLQTLPGIGPFSAELILIRGAGAPDVLPAREGRLGRAVALAYGLPAPPWPADLERLAEGWRPYRSWVALLLRTAFEEETCEIASRGRQ